MDDDILKEALRLYINVFSGKYRIDDGFYPVRPANVVKARRLLQRLERRPGEG